MANLWRRAMLYLGLGSDDEYDDLDMPGPAEDTRVSPRTVVPRYPSGEQGESTYGHGAGGHLTGGTVRTLPREAEVSPVQPRPRPPSVVRTISASVDRTPYVVVPRSFNHAKEVADRFKDGQPVIVNLQNVDRDLARRLIDFGAGLCYALDGKMDKVATQVYLLTPQNVEVSAEERRQLSERDYDD